MACARTVLGDFIRRFDTARRGLGGPNISRVVQPEIIGTLTGRAISTIIAKNTLVCAITDRN